MTLEQTRVPTFPKFVDLAHVRELTETGACLIQITYPCTNAILVKLWLVPLVAVTRDYVMSLDTHKHPSGTDVPTHCQHSSHT